MYYGKNDDEVARVARRKQKFSNQARDTILNDVLRDSALLSRSTQSSSSKLLKVQKDSEAREALLTQLENQDIDSHTYGHGLRKLREVIVSIYDSEQSDTKFKLLVMKVYTMSYRFFLKNKEYHKLGGIVLNFIIEKKLYQQNIELLYIFILYKSFIEKNIEACIGVILKWQLKEQCYDLLQLSLIYLQEIRSPMDWFQIVSAQAKDKLVYEFIYKSPAFQEMKERTFIQVSRCYNQIPLAFLREYWFQGLIDETEIADHFQIEKSEVGTKTIYFKKRH